jgi:hypothetical protein
MKSESKTLPTIRQSSPPTGVPQTDDGGIELTPDEAWQAFRRVVQKRPAVQEGVTVEKIKAALRLVGLR